MPPRTSRRPRASWPEEVGSSTCRRMRCRLTAHALEACPLQGVQVAHPIVGDFPCHVSKQANHLQLLSCSRLPVNPTKRWSLRLRGISFHVATDSSGERNPNIHVRGVAQGRRSCCYVPDPGLSIRQASEQSRAP